MHLEKAQIQSPILSLFSAMAEVMSTTGMDQTLTMR
jgi:hypothetical protein